MENFNRHDRVAVQLGPHTYEGSIMGLQPSDAEGGGPMRYFVHLHTINVYLTQVRGDILKKLI